MKEEIVVKGFYVCDYAYTDTTNKVGISGIFDQITSDKFPATHPLAYLVGIISGPKTKKIEASVRLVDQTDNPMGPGQSLSGFFSNTGGWNFILRMPLLQFQKPGTYRFQLLVDSKLVTETTLTLIMGKGEQHGPIGRLSA